ncbi:MAG: hypothetical protein IH841_08945 [Thaumarchaeota archaeon]|nr:hypothetical protein [Nitrososphaerota archaeon]
MSVVKTCINIERVQLAYIKNSDYSLSKLVRNQINELMKKSEGQTLREQPTDEPQKGSSNDLR